MRKKAIACIIGMVIIVLISVFWSVYIYIKNDSMLLLINMLIVAILMAILLYLIGWYHKVVDPKPEIEVGGHYKLIKILKPDDAVVIERVDGDYPRIIIQIDGHFDVRPTIDDEEKEYVGLKSNRGWIVLVSLKDGLKK